MFASALKSLGFPIGNVNNEKLEDEGFWQTIPVALDNGARRGSFRDQWIIYNWIKIHPLNFCQTDSQFFLKCFDV